MSFTDTLKEVVWRLVTEERISYRSIRSDFGLDDESMEELRFFLVQKKALARDEDGKFLVWVGTGGRIAPSVPEGVPPSADAETTAPEPIEAPAPIQPAIIEPTIAATETRPEAILQSNVPVGESTIPRVELLAEVARQLNVPVGGFAEPANIASHSDLEPKPTEAETSAATMEPVAKTVLAVPETESQPQETPETPVRQPALSDDEISQVTQAIADLYRQGQEAVLRSGHDEVIQHAMRALDLLRTLPEIPERAASELALQDLLGAALVATKGYGARETGAAFDRARALCQTAGTSADPCPALSNVWAFQSTRANHAVARQVAEEIFTRATATGNQDSIIVGQVSGATNDLHLGELTLARRNFDQATVLLEKHRPAKLGDRFGIDFGAANHAYAAWCECLLGRSDRALRLGNLALSVSNKEKHRYSIAHGHYWNAVLYQFRGEWRQVRDQAKIAKNLGLDNGFPVVAAAARIMLGAANVGLGEASDGFQKMREGLDAYRSTGARLHLPYHLALLAEALRSGGDPEESLAALNEASTLVKTTGERFIEAEIHRIRASALLAEESSAKTEAVASLRKALDIARSQEAKLLELRAACDLAGIWSEDGERQQAHDLLAGVYGDFKEGLNTPPLTSARQLINSLQ